MRYFAVQLRMTEVLNGARLPANQDGLLRTRLGTLKQAHSADDSAGESTGGGDCGGRAVAHHHHGGAAGGRLGPSIVVTLVFVTAEFFIGLMANSLALVSDAAHNFTDALALLLAWYAARISRRPANDRKTFGYHRATILSALANAVALVMMAVWIGWEALHRLQAPEPIQTTWMIAVALAAVGVNLLIGFWLHAGAKDDLNIRAAFLHQVGDALAAVGVVISGIIIAITDWYWVDPAISLVIAGMILWSSRAILIEAVDVLLEAVPANLNRAELVQSVEQIPGVRGVHDLHVWTISSGMIACSCHLRIDDQLISDGQRIQQAVAQMLQQRFHIGHSTIQIETDATCAAATDHCEWQRPESHDGHNHDHGDGHDHGYSHSHKHSHG
ncbi:cation diffusion facilitator family transporter [Tuwongella immobilis]|uniref:Cation efflux protein cytoplasmic domain-containing protein n=1 Tax=Tuwongella immobilis TaxID=692036 RepID=A0A6C2YW01_9BACT|nr:cation diffusion facilitator family transporter [Tuwongella immobilis]VIP05075.1 cation diffusion facilitator family transporter : Cation diffusion facilitator family transporter OS=Chthonomonas calidirosea (strain DSM 23976 / ICMP 18418 / T49) GN=CCALI_00715 PE=4 SV=1: Cation_efflux [Tuwongella immobilis]VTS07506.1 cation diffusion facilitator family transporter : Cation diffusion facilitator family transporter OS=Chthonomonas calidirosea (strain DSM 23976 / ICMP 18418 / T49) GN=CCALI_00715 P